tara:strand:- start:29542 stop:29922 length:381 start_codon:yes stop_codon:yes gene_type:complete
MKFRTLLVGLFLLPCNAFLLELHDNIVKPGLHNNAPHIVTFGDDIQRAFGKKIVIDLSYMLPKLDIGHDILAADHKLILDLFTYDDYIPHYVKKDIILLSIKMAQYGDNIGSILFQEYYNLVDKLI